MAESSPFRMEDTEKTGAAPGTRLSLAGPAGAGAAHSDHHETESVRPGGRGSTVQMTVPGNSDQGASLSAAARDFR